MPIIAFYGLKITASVFKLVAHKESELRTSICTGCCSRDWLTRNNSRPGFTTSTRGMLHLRIPNLLLG